MGLPLTNFSRMYFHYSYDRVYVRDLNQAFFDGGTCLFTPEGCQTIDFDKLTPRTARSSSSSART